MTRSGRPKVSVVMPVYNGGKYLHEAIESILAQTFTDFEFIVIDDGSTDNSYDIAAAFSDGRIRLVRQESNLGLVSALNLGLILARGEYVARMDADDISLPERLLIQVDFMDANPAVGVCGSWLQVFSSTDRTAWYSPISHNEIYARLLFESALFHPTVFMRKSFLDAHNILYKSDFRTAEDYELWSRCITLCRFANIGKVLLHYRSHDNNAGILNAETKQQSADKIHLRWLHNIGLHPSGEEVDLHRQISQGQVPAPVSSTFFKQAHDWLLKIRNANELAKILPEPELSEELSQRWFLICDRSTALGPVAATRYFLSPFFQHFKGKKRALFALLAKSLLHYSGR